ncbi:hypothetical protein [Sphingobacterium sp.]|uniref:hypothetical protein n=1 Tax=Sphingobacterium sp. TaxID=341027 RepID=UPI0031D98520
MKILGLLAIGLLLGTTGMAQETKAKVHSSQNVETTLQNNKSKKTATLKAEGNGVAEQEIKGKQEVARSLDAAETKGKTAVSQLTKTVSGAETGKAVSELATAGKVDAKTEHPDNHGAAVSTVAKSDIAADVKGSTISTVASSVGQAHATVKTVDVATQAAVKSTPNVKANVNAKTKIDVNSTNVRTNTKIRTGVGIK